MPALLLKWIQRFVVLSVIAGFSCTSPGNSPYVITVGAMTTMGTASRVDDSIASYSSKGPTLNDHVVKPDLVAPGNRIIALADTGSQLYQSLTFNLLPLSYYMPGAAAIRASTSG